MSYLVGGLAVALYALSNPGAKRRLLNARRRFIIWADLDVDIPGSERRVYTTFVANRRYERIAIIINCRRVLRIAKRLLGDEVRLRRLVRRHIWIAREVLYRVRVTSRGRKYRWAPSPPEWLKMLPRRLARRVVGLEPFRMGVYDMFRRRSFMWWLRGDARAWGYVLYRIALSCKWRWCKRYGWTFRSKRTDVKVL